MINVGDTFEFLTVIAKTEERRTLHNRFWLCECVCGQRKLISANSLRRGETRSCGCRRGLLRGGHGLTKTPEHIAWVGMRSRCLSPKDPSYPRYGGRGIAVCKRWDSFAVFLADMGPRPGGHTLERVDNDGDYEPGNCIWATMAQQNRNKSSSRLITFEGQTMNVVDWASVLGIKHGTLSRRLNIGWSVERALTEPVHGRSR